MLGSFLPFSEDIAGRVSDYCEKRSTPIPKVLLDHWNWTRGKFSDADKMSSRLQGSWMIFTAEGRKPKTDWLLQRYSAIAWYEGTKETQAEIITLELSPKMIAVSKEAFKKFGVTNRVTLKKLDGNFDLIFVDANKDGYESYVQTILDRKLLSPNGIIYCDNVFSRGLTIGTDCAPWVNDHIR